MKKIYMKPSVEVEQYTLSMSIASNCATVVNNGPVIEHHTEVCSTYEDPFATTYALHNVSFYDDTVTVCDCYYSSSEAGYWMS